jgi:TolB-like protein/Tfp pilus assembly protein PilF
MASIISGYEYDIFISYRQKDNKGDRWVSEFVEALRIELESTFKEEIGVYFDINPHDGLLETYDVDASLKDKLKCLVFIPIISRTYCDPKSFAWEHEFKTFLEQASKDQFGLKVKLPNGNIASRLIPVQIHDLYPEDKALVEKEIGGYMRAIEFIYKEPGINKPLTADDDEKRNLNNTKYRLQINKVANAIDEIIHGLRSPISQESAKTVPVYQIKEPTSSIKEGADAGTSAIIKIRKSLLLTGAAVIIIIAGLFAIYKFIVEKNQADDIAGLEKSVAILPFRNDSPNDSTTYFINGLMEKVLNNLQLVKELRVISRTSVEQYRNSTKSIPEIAKEQGVNFIVEGSGQKYGNTFNVSVQLIKAEDEKHLWGDSYEQEIRSTKDIFRIQSQVAQAIAEALEASITPDEKQKIDKIPTANLTAYDLEQRGSEELYTYWLNMFVNKQALLNAEEFFKKALMYDSTYAQAYIGLANIYDAKHQDDMYLSENYLDSMLIYIDRALLYDDKFPYAFAIKAMYYTYTGKSEPAKKEFENALKCDPNDGFSYLRMGALYCDNNEDYVKGLQYLHKAVSLSHGRDLIPVLQWLGNSYLFSAGFPDLAKKYYQEALQLDNDTGLYFRELANMEFCLGNYEKSFDLSYKAYSRDSNNFQNIYNTLFTCYFQGKYPESMKYVMKVAEEYKSFRDMWIFKIIGHIYWLNGNKKEAYRWFDKQRKACQASIKWGRYENFGKFDHYQLAALCAFLGERDKAYENLREFNKNNICSYLMLKSIETDPFFNSIRSESEFQKIVNELESKYQTEHERVRKWLEEQGKL